MTKNPSLVARGTQSDGKAKCTSSAPGAVPPNVTRNKGASPGALTTNVVVRRAESPHLRRRVRLGRLGPRRPLDHLTIAHLQCLGRDFRHYHLVGATRNGQQPDGRQQQKRRQRTGRELVRKPIAQRTPEGKRRLGTFGETIQLRAVLGTNPFFAQNFINEPCRRRPGLGQVRRRQRRTCNRAAEPRRTPFDPGLQLVPHGVRTRIRRDDGCGLRVTGTLAETHHEQLAQHLGILLHWGPRIARLRNPELQVPRPGRTPPAIARSPYLFQTETPRGRGN